LAATAVNFLFLLVYPESSIQYPYLDQYELLVFFRFDLAPVGRGDEPAVARDALTAASAVASTVEA
jgi:hypothetical protein